MHDVDSAYQIVWLTRRLFRALAHKSNASLDDVGISVADRAVMEFLYPSGELSVPEIAERYQVSRQHGQMTVNGLLQAEILATRVNPRHKRSPFITLTSKGKRMFRVIKTRDKKALKKLFAKISERDKSVTQKTLTALLSELN